MADRQKQKNGRARIRSLSVSGLDLIELFLREVLGGQKRVDEVHLVAEVNLFQEIAVRELSVIRAADGRDIAVGVADLLDLDESLDLQSVDEGEDRRELQTLELGAALHRKARGDELLPFLVEQPDGLHDFEFACRKFDHDMVLLFSKNAIDFGWFSSVWRTDFHSGSIIAHFEEKINCNFQIFSENCILPFSAPAEAAVSSPPRPISKRMGKVLQKIHALPLRMPGKSAIL